MPSQPVWTPDMDAALSALWLSGISTAKIGAELQKSKNSVVGRAHRIHLPDRPSPIRREHIAGGPVVAVVLPPPRPLPAVTLAPLPSLEAPPPAPSVVVQVIVPTPPPAPVHAIAPRNQPARLAPVVPPVSVPPRPSLAVVSPPTVFLPRRVGCCLMPMWSNNERTKFDTDGSPMLCRKPTIAGSGYCAEHHAATHVRLQRRA